MVAALAENGRLRGKRSVLLIAAADTVPSLDEYHHDDAAACFARATWATKSSAAILLIRNSFDPWVPFRSRGGMDVGRSAPCDFLLRCFPLSGVSYVMNLSSSRYAPYRLCSAICLFLLAFLALGVAAQQQPAGRVTVVLGTVEAVAQDGEVRTLGRGDPVFEGDTLRSGPGGRAQVRFTDRGMLSLRPNSEVALDEYEQAAAPAANRKQMTLSRGGFRAQTGSIARVNRQAYRVQAPVATMGIRGTVFDLYLEDDGSLLVGASQGAVEVETISGATGSVGQGEPFNYLRVRPDGSIEYLLELPEALIDSPELTARTDASPFDAGLPAQATIVTGQGAAETPAGYRTLSRERLLDLVEDPDATGIVNLARVGSGDIPGELVDEDPDPDLPEPVLTPEQVEALLADDRIALALGAAGDEDGAGLFGGIATVNSPTLALDSSTQGLAPGIAGADRQTLLDGADLFLFGDSGEVLFDEDVAGVAGLVWGRFTAPVTVFVDALDRDVTFGLDRDVLFAIGSPADLADLEGIVEYELFDFDVVSSGLPVAAMFSSGTLDLGSGSYAGSLEVILGESESLDDFSLLAEFESQVVGGVLEGVEFSILELLPFDDGPSEDAEGTLAGFFTGDGAAFLQLAFDFRVPSREDADVLGLALLEQVLVEDPGLDGLTPEEAEALSAGFAYIGVTCCDEAEGVEPPQVYGGLASDPRPSEGQEVLLGIALGEDGERVGALDAEFLAFPPALVTRGSDAEVLNFQPSFHVVGAESVAALALDRDGLPLRAFRTEDGELDRLLRESIFLLTGIPTPAANLMGWRRYELAQLVDGFAAVTDPSGEVTFLALFERELAFTVNLADGQVSSGFFSGQADDIDETVLLGFQVRFDGQVAIENDNAFVEFEITNASVTDFFAGDGGLGFSVDPDAVELGGFFTGDTGEAFAAAFKINAEYGDFFGNGEDTSLFRLFGTALLAQQDLTLNFSETQALTDPGLLFVGATGFEPGAILIGRTTMQADFVERASVLGLTPDGSGGLLKPGDMGFIDLPSQLLRPGSARIPGFLGNLGPAPGSSNTQFRRWLPVDGEPLLVDAESGEILDTLSSSVFFLNATPTTLPAEGFTTFAGSRITNSLQIDQQRTTGVFGSTLNEGTASFSLDLTTGEISAGQLFAVARRGQFSFPDLPEREQGFQVFFDGQLVNTDEGSFIEVQLLDGSFEVIDFSEGTSVHVPIDLEASSIEGFFAGDSQPQLNAAFLLRTIPDEEGNFEASSGVFTVGNSLLPETRLIAEEVSAWVRSFESEGVEVVRPGFGLAAFSPAFTGQVPGNGVLLGRAPNVELDGDFVLGANALRVLGSEGEVVADTRRGGFLAQPFDFILRQSNAFELEEFFVSDVRADGTLDFEGFEVTWGAWRDPGSDSAARIQIDPADPNVTVDAPGRVHFASVNPSPISGLPPSGMFLYGGPTVAVGSAQGDFAGGDFLSPVAIADEDFFVEFVLNFGTGLISDGVIRVSYGVEPVMEWRGEFDGVLNGAVTDFTLRGLDLFGFGELIGGADLDRSAITGLLTGPGGERHAGAFSFLYVDGELFESVRGLWVTEQLD
ncbi:MAG: hypothetical protein EA417_13570 [Gammaproteobacteria bacterium]|nr:MAG: hypothetical protein EA417_13570 [Gammaproteobacteria bacterium]